MDEKNKNVEDYQEEIMEMVKEIGGAGDMDSICKIFHYILPKYKRVKKEAGY